MSAHKPMDDRVDALYLALQAGPVKTARDLAKRLKCTTGQVHGTLWWVRHHAAEYGWTVLHTVRGGIYNGEASRYIAVQVDSEGEPYFTPEQADLARAGGQGTVSTIGAMAQHEAVALGMALPYFDDPAVRAEMDELREELEYVARKTGRILRRLEALTAA